MNTILNMDFNQPVVLDTNRVDWQPTSVPGVTHKPLAYADGANGHYTSMVRYRAGTTFSRDEHTAGEEILVLAGTFVDETGNYPTGSYYRVPPGSGHMPFSQQGCVLLLKRHQFKAGDVSRVAINTRQQEWLPGSGGMSVMRLHEFQGEQAALVKWPANQTFHPQGHIGGEEIFVLSGELIDENGRYSAGIWLRSPQSNLSNLRTKQETVAFVKVGHLPMERTA